MSMNFDFLISDAEISKLLLELEIETSLYRKKPSDIEKNPNMQERMKELTKLDWLDQLYVLPLKELANRINIRLTNRTVEFVGLENLSIMGRMMKIREFLLSKGCTLDTIMQVVPKSEQENNILIEAKAHGFNLGFAPNQTLDNTERVARAQMFLNSLNNDNQTVYGNRNR